MNAAWIDAAESLIPELFCGELLITREGGCGNRKVADVGDFGVLLTNTQRELGVSPQLVYMCGLVTYFQRNPPFSKQQIDWFQRLQSLLQKEKAGPCLSSKSSTRFYQLSPTLLPTNDVQDMIHQHVSRRLIDIEAQAESARLKLLSMEKTVLAKTTKKTGRKLKDSSQKPSPQPPSDSLSTESNNDDNGRWDSDEENVSFSSVNVSMADGTASNILSNLLKSKFDSDDSEIHMEDVCWTQVKTQRKGPESHPSFSSIGCGKVENSCVISTTENALDSVAPTSDSSVPLWEHGDDKITMKKDTTLDNAEVQEEVVAASDISNPDAVPCVSLPNRICLGGSKEHDTDVLKLQDQINRLELELRSKDELLQRERTAHAKTVLQEKEQSHERLQSLQLRLYISETRLKAFEDALDQHIEAVASNVAIGSPERRVRRARVAEVEETEVITPLYSRSLRK